jgi:raffinose/stachyose/melibiose transport system permease protein
MNNSASGDGNSRGGCAGGMLWPQLRLGSVAAGQQLRGGFGLIFGLIVLLVLGGHAIAGPIEIEVALQDGGEGQEIFQRIARLYEADHPQIKINLYGDPRIGDLLHVRILEKDFPEITNGDFGGWNLIRHGDVQELDQALDGPDYDHTGSWRDSFLPGTLDRYTEGGKSYAVPLSYYVQSIYYNRSLFRANHWGVPRTWDQLLSLCSRIKQSGLSPFAFQGRYPYYAQALVDSAYYQQAGKAGFDAQKKLEPGSYDNLAMRQALGFVQTLSTQYFQPGAMGMGHTEAQLQFFLGHTAMIPCGSWLKSEMSGKIPEGFELGTFNLPTVGDAKGDAKGDATALLAASGYYTVFSHSKHPNEAVDFLRFLTSKRIATLFCSERDIPVAIRGVNEASLSPDLSDLAQMIRNSKTSYGEAPGEGFPQMGQYYNDALQAVLVGRLTPDQAAVQLEQAAVRCRFEVAHPDEVPARHTGKALLLLGALVLGSVYAIWTPIRRGRLARARSSGQPLREMSSVHALLFVGPALLLFGLFILLPAVKGFGWSALQWDGLTDSRFVGLRHFRHLLLSSDGFWIALGNNFYIMFVIPVLMVPLSLFLAAAVSRGVHGSRVFKGAFLLPSVMGGVAATLLWMHLYDPQAGIINAGLVAMGNVLCRIGLSSVGHVLTGFNGFAWLSQDHLYTALLPMSVWGGFGFNFILYLAAMEGIPAELYEASELDGASHWQQFWIVTLPLIWEVLTISTVFMIIGGMKAFESIWLLTNQAPATSTHVIGTRMVQTMLSEMNVGEATAIAVLLFVMVFVATAAAMTAMKREAIEM